VKSKLLVIPVLLLSLLSSGCIHSYWNERKELVYNEITNSTNELYSVRIGQYAILYKSDINNLKIPYKGGSITLGSFSTKGDVEMMDSISKMVVYSIAAYGSMGAYPTTVALLEALKSGEVDRVVAKVNKGEAISIDDFPVAKSLCKPGQVMIQSKPDPTQTWINPIFITPTSTNGIPFPSAPTMLLTSP